MNRTQRMWAWLAIFVAVLFVLYVINDILLPFLIAIAIGTVIGLTTAKESERKFDQGVEVVAVDLKNFPQLGGRFPGLELAIPPIGAFLQLVDVGGADAARRLVELIGLGQAQGLIYRSATVTAEEALRLGLVHEVLDDETELAARVEELARQLAALSPQALTAQKAMFRLATKGHPGAARAAEAELFARIWRNPEHQKYLSDFNKG